MSQRSRFQRLALLAAVTTTVAGGVLVPATAFAAPAASHTVTHDRSDASVTQWVETTDAPSGIKIRLPGNPATKQLTKAKDGADVRVYMVGTDSGPLAFEVVDAPDVGRMDLDDGLHGFVDGWNEDARSAGYKLTSSDARPATVDGRPALDAHLSTRDGGAGSIRLVKDGDHCIVILGIGHRGQEKPMDDMYQQTLTSLHMPDTGAAHAA